MICHRLLLTATALLGVVLGGSALWLVESRRPEPASVSAGPALSGTAAVSPVSLPASDVLRAWDRERSRAFARGDAAAVSALYVPGSRAGTSDLAMLRAYRARGLLVQGMRMQILSLVVLDEAPRRLRLEVTDRLVGAVAVGHRQRLALPRDRASTRVIELRRVGSSWRVASVRGASPRRDGR